MFVDVHRKVIQKWVKRCQMVLRKYEIDNGLSAHPRCSGPIMDGNGRHEDSENRRDAHQYQPNNNNGNVVSSSCYDDQQVEMMPQEIRY